MAKSKSKTTRAGQAGPTLEALTPEAALEAGFFGRVADPTPNANYGLTTPPDAPVPETDLATTAQARAGRDEPTSG